MVEHSKLHGAKPPRCKTPWKELYGDERERSCLKCGTTIYSVDDEKALNALVPADAQLFRRADGRIALEDRTCSRYAIFNPVTGELTDDAIWKWWQTRWRLCNGIVGGILLLGWIINIAFFSPLLFKGESAPVSAASGIFDVWPFMVGIMVLWNLAYLGCFQLHRNSRFNESYRQRTFGVILFKTQLIISIAAVILFMMVWTVRQVLVQYLHVEREIVEQQLNKLNEKDGPPAKPGKNQPPNEPAPQPGIAR
jgi:hypothetical protein